MPKNRNYLDKVFIIASIANLFVLLGLFLFFQNNLVPSRNEVQDKIAAYKNGLGQASADPYVTKGESSPEEVLSSPIIDNQNPSLGPIDAKVTIVEFSDFTCKFCGEQEKIIKEVMSQYQGKVRLIWKDYPDVGADNWRAAIAARCAFAQNKFWEYHDLLFANTNKFDNSNFVKLSKKIGLDQISFKTCLDKETYDAQIKSNIAEASALRLPGVPFFFVNNQEILGSISKDDLVKMIEVELKK